MNIEKMQERTKAAVTDKKLSELYRACLMKGWRFVPPKSWVIQKAS